jgi:hypothetical protein
MRARGALETAGVEFTNGNQPGARLKALALSIAAREMGDPSSVKSRTRPLRIP